MLPARAGLGLHPGQVDGLLAAGHALGFAEVHAENYLVAGGPLRAQLDALRARHPLSLHGVGLSIGGAGPLDRGHLAELAALVRRSEPAEVSEHLAWSGHAGHHLNHLLPLPFNAGTLRRVVEHVDQLQSALGRRVLIENPSTYLAFDASTLAEGDFLSELVRRSGCGLLLDLSNLHLSAVNQGQRASTLLDSYPLHAVGELHVAGFATECDAAGAPLLIDTHDRAVDPAVWSLVAAVLQRRGPLPLLIERDQAIPPWPERLAELAQAQALLDAAPAVAGARAPQAVPA